MTTRRLVSCMLVVCASPGEAKNLPCPQTIAVRESAAAVPGWNLRSGTRQVLLERVVLYLRRSGELAAQVPDEDSDTGTINTVRWVIPAEQGSQFFLACEYVNSSIRLMRPIPRSRRQCKARFSSAGDTKSLIELSCE